MLMKTNSGFKAIVLVLFAVLLGIDAVQQGEINKQPISYAQSELNGNPFSIPSTNTDPNTFTYEVKVI